MGNSKATAIVEIRPGVIRYYDMCSHADVSKEEFFSSSDTKILKYYGLILRLADVVKIMHNEDESDNSQCEGMVIPIDCIISITYFKDDIVEEFGPPAGPDVN